MTGRPTGTSGHGFGPDNKEEHMGERRGERMVLCVDPEEDTGWGRRGPVKEGSA